MCMKKAKPIPRMGNCKVWKILQLTVMHIIIDTTLPLYLFMLFVFAFQILAFLSPLYAKVLQYEYTVLLTNCFFYLLNFLVF